MDTIIELVLDQLESQETRLLSWGHTQGYFVDDEIDLIVNQVLAKAGESFDPVDIADEMVKRGLLFEWNESGKTLYRTRMAESVRLYANLRQMFPKHKRGDAWLQAPTLVSDFRFLRRKRKYPRRDQSAQKVINSLKKSIKLSESDNEVLGALLKHGDGFYALSNFQHNACHSVLRGVRQRTTSTGSIVCAGTGSGKTLAFYLPALTHIGSELIAGRQSHVQALAIYPRNELLKDQFIETWSQARKLDTLLLDKGARKLRIGAFFGMAPKNAQSVTYSKVKGWQCRGEDHVCLYVRCPGEDQHGACQGKMIWSNTDRLAGVERLRCDRCDSCMEHDEIILTRERMLRERPDILFTTTEMLNRHLGNKDTCRLFGVGDKITAPAFILLDEVHTYSGIGGAQVGMLLRRWRYLAKARSHFVGLSATLEQAPRFMATLTGLEEFKVAEISPTEGEMEQEGAEYMLVLRGDPASRSSLLSTTIQASMLTKRIMDPAGSAEPSKGLYGKRTFVFTDDMDVINRLYFQLLDAEGRYSNGNINGKKSPLASLRRPDGSPNKFALGQSWDLPLAIGHNLNESDRADIKRTSSQDTGVDQAADVIVATASLEVGFNDPSVGAVIQHKAPRDNAQFLQRKGRAGRKRKMRPWTVVVLSDYGRDRLAFQSYEGLFDPELKARQLPIKNSYVMRIQAVFATMDWFSRHPKVLAVTSPAWAKKSIWDELSAPQYKNNSLSSRQKAILLVVENLLEKPSACHDLAKHLQQALELDESVVESLLWQPPRAIMTSFLPTLRRRLKTLWSKNGEIKQDNCRDGKPMTEFIPTALFSDLCLPEVEIRLPDEHLDEQMMPILQGMKDFAPGRISKRFAKDSIRQRHWTVPKGFIPVSGNHPFPLTDYCPDGLFESMGNCVMFNNRGHTVSVPCLRAYAVDTSTPDDEFKLSETSNAFLDWHTEIRPPMQGEVMGLPEYTRWSQVFEQHRGIEFYTHQRHCPVEVVRFATGSKAEMKFTDDRDPAQIQFDFIHEQQPASIGFSLWVDAIAFRFRLPDLALSQQADNGGLIAGLRTARFLDEVRQDQRLTDNTFLAGWLGEAFLAAVSCQAVLAKSSIRDAVTAVCSAQAQVPLMDIPSRLFQTLTGVNESTVDQDLQLSLRDLFQRDGVIDLLADWAELLWQEPDQRWHDWLSQCFKTTLGGALQQTVFQLCPDAGEENLVIDLCGGPDRVEALPEGVLEIWLSETDIGGGGILERVERSYQEDPRRFFDLLEFNLRAGDYETMDHHLFQFLETVEQQPTLAQKVSAMRQAQDHQGQLHAHRELLEQLQRRGFMTSHQFMSAMNTRVLRAGSDSSTDQLLLKLMQGWRNEELRLGIELPQRVYAFTCAQGDLLDGLRSVHDNTENWRLNLINGLLWPRGYKVRDNWLNYYNPYAFAGSTERLLLSHCIESRARQIYLSSTSWLQECHQELANSGRCELVAESDAQVNGTIALLLTEPVDMYGLHFYPRVVGVQRDIKEIKIMLDIAEAIQ